MNAQEISNLLIAMPLGSKKTINGAKVYLPKAGGYSVTISGKMEHYSDTAEAAVAIEHREHHYSGLEPMRPVQPKPEVLDQLPRAKHGRTKSGNPQADRDARDAKLARTDTRLDRFEDAPELKEPTREAAAKSVKRAAKQDLATRVALALADLAKDLDGSLALEGMTQAEAGQTLANWIHHLPVRREDWPATLPKPDRSNWK